MRLVRRRHHAFGERRRDDGLARQLADIRRADDTGDMVGMMMGQHDQPRGIKRARQLLELVRIIRLAGAESVVRRAVKPGIDHDGAIGIDHLKGRARHRDRGVVTAADDEFARTDRSGDARQIDRNRQRTRQQAGQTADGAEVGVERLFVNMLADFQIGGTVGHAHLPHSTPILPTPTSIIIDADFADVESTPVAHTECSPPPCGEGLGVGVLKRQSHGPLTDPPPRPSPTRGEGTR